MRNFLIVLCEPCDIKIDKNENKLCDEKKKKKINCDQAVDKKLFLFIFHFY